MLDMKESMLVVTITVLFVVPQVVISPGDAFGQDDVIKTTKDSRGFEKRHTEADLMYETAKQLMAAKQWDKAAVELEKVIAVDIKRLDALHDLGTCYGHTKQYDKAAVVYKKACEAHPGDVRLLTNLGYYQMRAKDVEGAMGTYEAVLKEDPANYEGNRWLGYIYEKQAEAKKDAELYQTSLEYYEKALEAKSDDVKSMGSIAKIYYEMGENDKALAMYEQAIPAADEETALALKSQLGKMYIDAGEFEKSAAVFNDLVTSYPDKPSYRYNLGVSLIQLKKYGDALPHLERAIEAKPEFCPAYQPLATCYEENKRYNDAMGTVRKGLQVCGSGKQAGLYYEWGKSLEGLGRYGEAIEKFQLAVKDPTWGPSARKQIKRQEDLIKRAKAMENQ
jgi:tetratricopeptide (TPR) repeat protein